MLEKSIRVALLLDFSKFNDFKIGNVKQNKVINLDFLFGANALR